ncbi:DUF4277 domain-containing protein [Dolichospermum sp. FACHB-1091]|nr:DUF4277 domain-containing protein [Dolichospermum sp. FACHB-1091]
MTSQRAFLVSMARMKESKEAMQILNIDHLGIVAGIIDEMELVE